MKYECNTVLTDTDIAICKTKKKDEKSSGLNADYLSGFNSIYII